MRSVVICGFVRASLRLAWASARITIELIVLEKLINKNLFIIIITINNY